MSEQFSNVTDSFVMLLKTVRALRDPQTGCPWDLQQTPQSLLPYLLEEAQEYINVVENKQEQDWKEELGDVFFQVVLHSQLADEKKLFDIGDLCLALNKKLIQRHPHVFNNESSTKITATQVTHEWERKKTQAGLKKLQEAAALPPMLAAQKIGKFSQAVGFDWQNAQQVWLKVEEEMAETKEAIQSNSTNQMEDEIGDLLFSVVQLARHLNLSADYCLQRANKKFQQRFEKLYALTQHEGKDLLTMPLGEKEALWQKIKESSRDSQ